MSAPTCSTCRHWKSPGERVDFRHLFRGNDADRTYGICKAIDLAGSYDHAPDPLPLAVTKDGSDYDATLHTQAEFGCAMHELAAHLSDTERAGDAG